jgi:hypothetical protein
MGAVLISVLLLSCGDVDGCPAVAWKFKAPLAPSVAPHIGDVQGVVGAAGRTDHHAAKTPVALGKLRRDAISHHGTFNLEQTVAVSFQHPTRHIQGFIKLGDPETQTPPPRYRRRTDSKIYGSGAHRRRARGSGSSHSARPCITRRERWKPDTHPDNDQPRLPGSSPEDHH